MPASSPTANGNLHFLPDLLFSSRAAFVWNSVTGAVAWANGAAREKFQTGADNLAAAFSKTTIQRLNKLSSDKTIKNQNVPVKTGTAEAVFAAQPLQLSGGDRGLIVAEIVRADAAPRDAPFRKNASEKKTQGKRKTASINAKIAPGVLKPAAPALLTDAEMRSFKAIGRKVRKLAREKLSAKPNRAATQISRTDCRPVAAWQATYPDDAMQMLLPVFDIFAIFDKTGQMLKIEGRPQRLGWRKTGLLQSNVRSLFCTPETGIIERIMRKLETAKGRQRREHLTVLRGDGGQAACRAVFGNWQLQDNSFFVALISLDPPIKVQKSPYLPLKSRVPSRLAA